MEILSSWFTDTGFKLIHSYKNSELALCSLSWIDKNVSTPSFQRYKSEDRISEIVNELSKRKEPTGIIILAKIKSRCFLIDGQHRLEGYKRLDIQPIPVQIYKFDNEEDMWELFCSINKMVPVEEYVLLAKSQPDRKKKMERLFQFIEETYPDYKSRGLETFRFPSISHLELKKHVSRFPFVEASSYEDVVDRFLDFNLECREELSEDEVERCEKKKIKNGKYLYISKFLRQVMKDALKEGDERLIGDDLRKQVWKKRNGEVIGGKCFCCDKGITFARFECGHIVSWATGESTTLDNLEPVCKNCNVKCGKKNLLEFKKGLKI